MKEKINVFALRKVFSEYQFVYLLSSSLKKSVETPCGFESVLSELFVTGMNYNAVLPADSWRKNLSSYKKRK